MASGLTGLVPVAIFLAALVLMDSYKLVRLRTVVLVLAAGVAAAAGAYAIHALILEGVALDAGTLSRYVAPVTEELLKGLVIVILIRTRRIGFLVDAAILGFAVGTGFAIVENLNYLRTAADAGIGTWIVRGFGTSLMHGGATALFAVAGLALGERRASLGLAAFAPGLLVAIALHSAFNHFFASPIMSTAGIVLVLPLLFAAVFERSERAVGEWLGKGLDADAQMLVLIESGQLPDAPVGRYLQELKGRFHGPIVADLLCYLRLRTELAMRAKGILMMREGGFEVSIDAETRDRFAEMRYLEASLGRTGLLAIQPMLPRGPRDLWQLYMLGK